MRTSGHASKIENSPAHVGYMMCETVPQATPRQTQEVVVGWVCRLASEHVNFNYISDAYCLLAPVLSWSAASRSNSALHLGHDLGS